MIGTPHPLSPSILASVCPVTFFCNMNRFSFLKYTYRLAYPQYIAAHLITGTNRMDHITPVLRDLHWLPIQSRIVFKILLSLTYKIINGQSPTYLINAYKPVRSRRSSDRSLLQIPDVSTATYGQRDFCFYVPKLWNTLPTSIKQSETINIFKKELKTFLCSNHFYP